ncbi:PRC-barrel domain-containing protein [Streptomyces sp. JJ66]|uniref:PRC-barrel domain-containing protein n=1 Tax=Streptomyces sp. JJ66 TaxID=2803843 RepID=UPI001C58397B|nr:PRC-barrel domain-containing protein [Streptomyces sp. JJ66]MBW1604500.1 PRC-barrel domain-containing protein [Streptomyces sp. JJ66]
MLLSQMVGLSVMSAADATTVGVTDGVVIDPAGRTVAALRLKKTGSGSYLPWSGVQAIGRDAVMATSGEALRDVEGDLARLADASKDLLGKRVLTDAGFDAGTVRDVDLDPETGAVLSLHTTQAEIPGAALLGLGSYAAVVRA